MTDENILIQEEVTARVDDLSLLSSSRERCLNILKLETRSVSDLADFFISLHIVLEIGINAFFREFYLIELKKKVDLVEVMVNLDRVSFRDKVTMFIYNGKFDFSGKLDEATHYHSVINTLKDFCGPRNQLLHGHAIATVQDGRGQRDTNLKVELTDERMYQQIEKFRFILEGIRFYWDCLDCSFTKSGKEAFKESYLSDGFLE